MTVWCVGAILHALGDQQCHTRLMDTSMVLVLCHTLTFSVVLRKHDTWSKTHTQGVEACMGMSQRHDKQLL